MMPSHTFHKPVAFVYIALCAITIVASAFIRPPSTTHLERIHHPRIEARRIVPFAAANKPSQKIDKELRRKLMQEASTPWRSVRFFFYGAFAFSAGVGLLTALAQLAGSLARQPNALPLSQSAQNVAVDLGVVGLCVLGYVVDSRAAVDVVTEPSKALSDDEAAERSFKLASLRVEIGTEERRRVATLETLRTKAGQSVVVLGGPAKAVNEALTDALIQQKLLARAECVIVPVRTDIVEPQKIDRTGFIASIPPDERDDWLEYVADEIKTARDQGADDADSAGVVIAVRNDGTVARRGVGKPPWREVIAQLADDAPATDKVAK